jgi:cation diffusion facilitator family transporter
MASNSIGVLASALDSMADFFSSSINLISLRISAMPPDRDHPYGHGKIEGLAGLLQGALIGLGALALFAESLRRLLKGAGVDPGAWSVAVMAASAFVSALHGRGLRAAALRQSGAILKAEWLHFGADAISNLGVLAALALVRATGNSLWDLAVAGPLAGFIMFEAGRLARESLEELMDHGLSPALQREIEAAILSHHPCLVGFHGFRARKAGSRFFVDFHVEIRGVDSFEQAHDITEDLIANLTARFPNTDVTVHYDPEGAR